MQGPTNPKNGYPRESTKMYIIHSVTHVLLFSLRKAHSPYRAPRISGYVWSGEHTLDKKVS